MTASRALAAAVTLEHQVVYGYGVAGARLSGRERRLAAAAFDRHRLRRDQLVALIGRQGGTAPVAEAAYALPFPVADRAAARRLCATLEEACTGAAWDLVEATAAGAPERRLAVLWLTEAATTAALWRGTAVGQPPLPGQPRG